MILDSTGKPVSSGKLFDATKRALNRKTEPLVRGDFDDLISEYDLATLVSYSQKIYNNCGYIKAAIDQKGTYAIGKAWQPIYKGENKDWGNAAKEYLTDWYEIGNVRGGVFDFNTTLYLISTAIDIFGEAFVLMTEAETGYPQIQLIPSHRVGNRADEKTVERGFYRNLKINKGIIYNKKGRAVAYKILGNAKDGSLDFTVSARDLIHVFDPVYSDQSRGVPLVSHGINQLRDATEAEKRELFAMVINSSIALIESNESGSNENALQGVYGNAAQAGTGMETSWMEDGMIKYFKAGSGGKLETMNSQRPGPNWESFQSRVYESVLAGMGWPKSMVANSDNTGPVERAQLAKAEKAVEDRQSLVKPLAKKIVTYVISKAVEREDLNFNAEWYKWDFTLPRKISIDLGRESAARINEYNEGFTTLAHVVGENGEQLESHIDQRIYEKVLIAQKIKKANEENGVEITWKD